MKSCQVFFMVRGTVDWRVPQEYTMNFYHLRDLNCDGSRVFSVIGLLTCFFC